MAAPVLLQPANRAFGGFEVQICDLFTIFFSFFGPITYFQSTVELLSTIRCIISKAHRSLVYVKCTLRLSDSFKLVEEHASGQ